MVECPTCDSEIDNIEKFHFIFLKEFSSIKSSEIEAVAILDKEETLLKKSKWWSNKEAVPLSVRAFFKENPQEVQAIHADGFVYQKVYLGTEERYARYQNYAQNVRALLESDHSLKGYFNQLEQLVGQEVPTSMILPWWFPHRIDGVYDRSSSGLLDSSLNVAYTIPELIPRFNSTFNLYFKGEETGISGINLSFSMHRDKKFIEIPLLQLGRIVYEGRFHKTDTQEAIAARL